MAAHNNHPLPAPPGPVPNTFRPSQEQSTSAQQARLRHKSRTFSFRSDKSQKSRESYHIDTHETTAEKEAKRLHTKADPTLAMNEAEPAYVQATVKSSLASLRNMQHKDSYGNPIAEPDRSNPTRSRWERPLDTIRSFEAAIDGDYSRKSLYRSDSESVVNLNRRSSYYSTHAGRFPHDSYYAGRSQPSLRPDLNHYDSRQGGISRDSYFDGQHGSYFNGNGNANGYNNGYNGGHSGTPPNPGRQRYPRMASEPQFGQYRQADPGVYPIPNNHRSYETVASALGSGSSGDPAGYQTDPTSSDNSSVERVQAALKRQPEPINDYGIGFSQTPTYQPSSFSLAGNGHEPNNDQANRYPRNNYGEPPSVPQSGSNGAVLRKPIQQPLNTSSSGQERPSAGEKRKSWFSRKFSKQS